MYCRNNNVEIIKREHILENSFFISTKKSKILKLKLSTIINK